jgi:hypothetical protein
MLLASLLLTASLGRCCCLVVENLVIKEICMAVSGVIRPDHGLDGP